MTAVETQQPIYTLACDHPGCDKTFEAPDAWDQRRPGHTRVAARKAGWDVPPMQGAGSRSQDDFCPDHHQRDQTGK